MQASLATPESLADQKVIVQQVFETMVNLPLLACAADALPQAGTVASLLEFTDPSAGAILVECTPGLAYLFTARLMSIKPPDSVDEDVADAMRELANMVGGNLKGLMPEETRVGIPRLLGPEEADALALNAARLSCLCFSLGDEHCYVSLFAAAAAS